MTLTPERLAELRNRNRIESLEIGAVLRSELMELLRAADDLNALLAAAESAVLMMSTKNSGELRAAIRRAKGEQP